jgi:hypothetical protein
MTMERITIENLEAVEARLRREIDNLAGLPPIGYRADSAVSQVIGRLELAADCAVSAADRIRVGAV